MTVLLHMDSGANRSDESITRRLTALFAESLTRSVDYRYRDLVADPVPPLDTAYCALGRRVERAGLVPLACVESYVRNPAESREWAFTRPLIDELLTADIVLIGAPMYNYSVPAALKAWIDRVSFPGAFVDPTGTGSLLRDTRIVVISARGGAYGPGTSNEARDFHTPYVRAYFAKQGVPVENMRFINVDLALAGVAPHFDPLRPQAAASLSDAVCRTKQTATELTASLPTSHRSGLVEHNQNQ